MGSTASSFSVPIVDIPLIGKQGGQTIGMPQIPKLPLLAAGGIATKPTLGVFGEKGPEAIVPLNQSSRFGGEQTIIIELDGREQARYQLDRQADRVRLKTGALF